MLQQLIKTSDKSLVDGLAQTYPGKVLWGWIYWPDANEFAASNPDKKIIFFSADDYILIC